MARRLTVAGIGASAGGVEALRLLVRELRPGSGLSYIVLLHLDPNRISALPDILARECPLPVRVAEDGAALEADVVHVVPPGVVATVAGGRIVLRPLGPSGRESRAIDVLFTALALDLRDHAIGVVLSGFGADGTLGIKAIKEEGGLTVAQGSDGTAPSQPGMPGSAIGSGLVDLVVPVQDIPAKLAEYAASFGALAALTASPEERAQEDQARVSAARMAICDVLLHQTGHDFSGYKERTFLRRVQRRMQVLKATSIEAYVEILRGEHEEAQALLRDLLISVTDFFRDPEAFRVIEQEVIPALLANKTAQDSVRVWVPGCTTGEEAYSIAMLLCEQAARRKAAPRLQVFATDIDEAALTVARAGRYPAAQLDGVSEERLDRFFTREGATRIVSKELRQICLFSAHSVIRDPPFSRLDLISCRNLLIYLDAGAQRELFPVFHFALRPRGYLFLGSAESAMQYGDLFAPVDKLHRIYQRRDHANPKVRLALPPSLRLPRDPATGSVAGWRSSHARPMQRAVAAAVLEHFAPPHVVVNREGDIVHYSARTGAFLEAAPGEPTRNLIALARPRLRLDLRTALHDAQQGGRSVTTAATDATASGEARRVTITVEMLVEAGTEDPLFLVVFRDDPTPAAAAPPVLPADAALAASEHELQDTRERLESLIEEYETAAAELRASNEELVSLNEETQSTNEELETSKEEQQSINEELLAVNHELQAKVEELDRAHSDLRNLFEATRIATVILDDQLVIRSFTPQAAEIFALLQTDRGRPLADIAGAISTEEVLRDARAVLTGRDAVERQVSRRDRRADYLQRIVPYRSTDGTMTGVLAAFVDVTKLTQQQVLIGELNHRVRNMLAVTIALTRQTLNQKKPLSELEEELVGRMQSMSDSYQLISRKEWGDVSLAELMQLQLRAHLSAPDRGQAEGPEVLLAPAEALALGLVLHELATNAVKYGALSNHTGRLSVTWRIEGEKDDRHLTLNWVERGGPVVAPPGRTGFGSDLIQGQIQSALNGTSEARFDPEGLSVTITLPLPGAAPQPGRDAPTP